MKVGELARATRLTVRTLHHWEERGLVVPSARTSSGHRVYDDQDVRSVYQVVALRELGLPLDAIGELLSSGSFATSSPRTWARSTPGWPRCTPCGARSRRSSTGSGRRRTPTRRTC